MEEIVKILLAAINAKYIHANLAVYSLKKYAANENVEIAEYTINHQQSYVLKELYKKKPDVLAVSCYIWNISYVREVLRDLSKVLPDMKIWLGGPEVSFDSEKILLENSYITGVMRGEGEEEFRLLVEHYVNGTLELENIKGITYTDGDNIVYNKEMPLLSLDDIPFCYDNLKNFENKIIYYEASRGCPFSCCYCLSSVERRVRFRSLDLVFKELKFFLDNKVMQVKFVDRTFNCKHEFTKAIWRFLIENDNKITNFHFEVSADLLDSEEIDIIKNMRPGLIQLEIGVQSTNENTIKAITRKMNFEVLSENVRKIRQYNNVHQHLDLIAGLPYEGYESFKNSYDDVYNLKPQQLQLGFLKVLKGSRMYKEQEKYGIKYMTKPPYEVLSTDFLNYNDILKIKLVEEMTEVYYNSGQFATVLCMIEKIFQSPFDMYEKIGEYYEKKGLFGVNHSRIRRYEILLNFIQQYDNDNIKIYRELMYYDLFLRENLKAVPAWLLDIADNTEYKDRIRDFYIREQEEPNYLKSYSAYQYKQTQRMTYMGIFSFDYTLIKTKEDITDEMLSTVIHSSKDSKKYFILFDYNQRNNMDYSAKAICVDV